MMPVPTHLKECVIPGNSKLDEEPLKGKVRCPCGATRVELLYPGQLHPRENVPCVAEIDGKCFLIIKARCRACDAEHLLFDKDFHGWDGFACHDPKQAALQRPPLTPWRCVGCGSGEHSAEVEIQSEGKRDFIDETGGLFDENRWPDAFSWFSISIQCASCGKKTNPWISHEAM